MTELLKILEEKFDDHFIRYGKSVEDQMDGPVEIRVRKGDRWAMTYFAGEHLDEKMTKMIVDMLQRKIKEDSQ